MALWDFDKQDWKGKGEGDRRGTGLALSLLWSGVMGSRGRRIVCWGVTGTEKEMEGGIGSIPFHDWEMRGKNWSYNDITFGFWTLFFWTNTTETGPHESQLCRHYICKARWGKEWELGLRQSRGQHLCFSWCVALFFALTHLFCSCFGVPAPL